MNGYLELEIKDLKQQVKDLEIYKAIYEMLAAHPEFAHTYWWDEHPEDYNDPCLCATCRSYMGE